MSFPRYERYKESGVEWLAEVPEHWDVTHLNSTVRRCKNGVWGDEEAGDGWDIPCVRVADFDRDKLQVKETIPTIRNVAENDRRGRVLRQGDLLLEKSGGGDLQPVGCVVLYNHHQKAVCSNFVARMQLAPGVNASFCRYLHSSLYDLRITTRSINQTSGIQNLDQYSYLSEAIALPSHSEQIAIGAFLDKETAKIDALIEEQRRLIELLKEKRQAVISHAVTKGLDGKVALKNSGSVEVGATPDHWGLVAAKSISTIFVPQRNKPELNQDGDGLPWITMDQMKATELGTSDLWVSEEAAVTAGTRMLAKGAVIASCVGNFGAASVNLREVVINQQLQAFIPSSRIRTSFLRYRVENAKPYFEQIGTSATIPYVNQQGFGALPIPLPPLIEQDGIINHLDGITARIDKLLAEVKSARVVLVERRSALISAAVTGKIDVRNYAKQNTGEAA